MEIGENHIFHIPCQPQCDDEEVGGMFACTATFLWDMLALAAEVPSENEVALSLRDKLCKVFGMQERVQRALQQLKGEETQQDENSQSYSAQIGETFELGAGGDANKMSIVLNVLGTGLGVLGLPNAIATERESLPRLMVLSLLANDPTVLCTMGPHFSFSSTPYALSWL